MFSLLLYERGSEMKQPVTNRDKSRSGEMNLQTNLLTNIAPPNPGGGERGRWNVGGKVVIYLMYLPCAYRNTCLKAENTLGNTDETVRRRRDSEEEKGEAKIESHLYEQAGMK